MTKVVSHECNDFWNDFWNGGYIQKYFPRVSKNFHVLQKKSPWFSLSGKSNNQFPCAMATLNNHTDFQIPTPTMILHEVRVEVKIGVSGI